MSTDLTVVPFGDTALLLTVPVGASPAGVAHLFTTSPETRGLFNEVVPGQDTVLLVLADPDRMVEAIAVTAWVVTAMVAISPVLTAGPTIQIPVTYDGVDLPELARLLGASVDELITEHCRAPWTVDFLGFAPGFPYLSNPSTMFDTPRRDTPRVRVPAGAVGVAAGQTCIYPSASPGGWNLIGHSDLTLFDPTNPDRPALLAPGNRVQFYPAPDSMGGRA